MKRAAAVLLAGAVLLGPASAEAEQADPASLRVRFDLPRSRARIGDPQQLTVVVERGGETGAVTPAAGDRAAGPVDLLLRLPPGVELQSEGWDPIEPPPDKDKEEKGTGPWKLFEREAAASAPAVGTSELLREPLKLVVTQDGRNWVITARAKWGQHKAFATVFATTENGKAEFHAEPRK